MSGLPVLTVQPRRALLGRYGLDVADVQAVVEAAIGGKTVGEIFEGDRRFPLVIRLPEAVRNDPQTLQALPIALPGGRVRPAARDRGYPDHGGPERDQSRERQAPRGRHGKRPRSATSAHSWPRCSGACADDVELPAGYWLDYGGTFEQLISATQRLQLVVPLTLLLIFGLLYFTFQVVQGRASSSSAACRSR